MSSASTAASSLSSALVFLSYAREDKKQVEDLYQRLSSVGFTPWMAPRDILPGERWQLRVKEAIQQSDFFLACLSSVAVSKRSYIRREFKGAIEKREELLATDIYLIPVRLEECEVPEDLQDHQWVDVFEDDGWERLVQALRVGLERRGKTLPQRAQQELDATSTPIEPLRQQTVFARPTNVQEDQPGLIVSPEQELTNSIGMQFVLAPDGEFYMGSSDGASDERPVHLVRISQPFYLGKYPVTQEEWDAIMEENPSHFKGAKRPVERVSWEDAQEFVRRLNEKEPGLNYRLPSEAEWEYAARAGSTAVYCFGDDAEQLGEYGWYAQNAGGETHPVGQLKANSWGLYDMHGNVWEWVQDWYGEYRAEPVTDPQGPSLGTTRVFRGGCWNHEAGYCRSAYRSYGVPGARIRNLGFRVLRTAL